MQAAAPVDAVNPVNPANPILATLNPAQRRAADADDRPLLIVAGAGTGKTQTLAHRVAALIARGADPRRILLLTFSRRAAQEMTRRALRLLARRPGGDDALPWAGTFHAIANRLLRLHARRARAGPGVHAARSRGRRRSDRSPAPRARPRAHRPPLPAQGDLPRDLLQRGQHPGAAARLPADALSVVPGMGGAAARAVRRLRRREGGAGGAGLRRSAALLVPPDDGRVGGGAHRPPLRPRAVRRIPGHQHAAGGDPAPAEARRARRHRRRRRRAGDLQLPRGARRQHPGVPADSTIRRRRS